MNNKQLNTMLTVINEGSISAAARKLFLSQPALSQYIILLEKELGCKLFRRDTSPISLTYEGEIYLEGLRKIQEVEQNLAHQLADIQSAQKGRISLAISPVRAQQLLPQVLPVIQRDLPGLDLRLVHGGDRMHLANLVLDGKADFCVTSGQIAPKLQAIHLTTTTHLIMLPLSHPVAQQYSGQKDYRLKPAVDLRDFENEQFVLNYPFQGGRVIVEKLFQENNMKAERFIEIYDYYTIIRLVEEGVGVAVVSDVNVMNHVDTMNTSLFRLTKPYHNELALCHRQAMYISGLMERFINICRYVPRWS